MAQNENLRVFNSATFETWLDGKDISWARVLAARAALRVLPIAIGLELRTSKDPVEKDPSFILTLLRASSISWAASRYAAHDMVVASTAASKLYFQNASEAAESAARAATRAAASAAATTATAAVAAAAAAASSSAAAAFQFTASAATNAAAATNVAVIWVNINQDMLDLLDGIPSDRLAVQPLWRGSKPIWLERVVRKIGFTVSHQGHKWLPWLKWYRDRLDGKIADDELELVRAFVPDSIWNKGIEAVNAFIETARGATKPKVLKSDPIRAKSGSTVNQNPATRKTKVQNPRPVNSIPPSARPNIATGVDSKDLLPDTPSTAFDFLNRAPMAFVLAGRINQIWDSQTTKSENDNGDVPASFVVHIDAPWGGGKTSFASYLTRILNHVSHPSHGPEWLNEQPLGDDQKWPMAFRRPWFIVHFDAWRNQHIDPPWWTFYQTMRQQILEQIKEPLEGHILGPLFAPWHRGKAWARELWWRVKTPDVVKQFSVTIVVIVVLCLLWWVGLAAFEKDGEFSVGTTSGLISILMTAVLGGAPAIRTLLTLFTSSLVPGTPDAAKNYSLGSGDPLNRFRKHFADVMRSCNRPILVVIDDLDRCEPKFVVDLVRGMQTILRSERVIYLLLGDRDWITQSFTVVNADMNGIEVGIEHEFGQRFVEKAIQFSFVLPEISEDDRKSYTRRILGLDQPQPIATFVSAPDLEDEFSSLSNIENSLAREEAANALRASAKQRNLLSTDLEKRINLELAQRSAADETAEAATRHRLEGITHVLPANPRQIKRIINTITYLQEVARLEEGWQPGETEWQMLARWIVLMIEWPKTWFTLSRSPEILAEVYKTKPKTALALNIKSRPDVMGLLDFKRRKSGSDWVENKITGQHVSRLAKLLPATSGEELIIKSQN